MKVLINYEPIKLISVCSQIKKEYKDKYDYENPPSGHLEELIKEISSLGFSAFEEYAMMLKDYDVNYLAYHLAKEENIIINSKILKIIMFRMSEDVFNVYFISWQKHYNLLSNNLGTKNLFLLADKATDKKSYLPENIYNYDFRSKMMLNSIDGLLSETVSSLSDQMDVEVSELLSVTFLINPSSVLGINILKKIYLFCSEKHLLKTVDLELCNIANSYVTEEKIQFFTNFVTKVNPPHYKNYLKLADLARTIIKKSEYDLDNLPVYIRTRFNMWFSLLDIDKLFGETERGVFWKARAIEYNAIKIERKRWFEMIIMRFEKFVATEFEIQGAIYIVTNEEFNTTTNNIIQTSSSKQDLKTRLYHKYQYTDNRIEHRGDWRTNVKYRISNLIKK